MFSRRRIDATCKLVLLLQNRYFEKGYGRTDIFYTGLLAAFLRELLVGQSPVQERAREPLHRPDHSCSIQPLDAPASHAVCRAVPAAAGRRDKAEAEPKEKMESVPSRGF